MTKEMLKDFIRPSAIKIVIAIILLGLSFFYGGLIDIIGVGVSVGGFGFPLSYIEMIYGMGDFLWNLRFNVLNPEGNIKFYPFNFIADFLFWYLVSSALILTFNKVRDKQKETEAK